MKEKIKSALKNIDLDSVEDNHKLIEMIRNYFNDRGIEYESFSYDDVKLLL